MQYIPTTAEPVTVFPVSYILLVLTYKGDSRIQTCSTYLNLMIEYALESKKHI